MGKKKSELSVDDFLAQQSEYELLATVEAVEDNPDLVKLTPWLSSGGGTCLCHYALNIPKESIESLHPTGDRHACCGKVLRVASIRFKEGATLELNKVFEQIGKRARPEEGAPVVPGFDFSSLLPREDAAGIAALENALRFSTSLGQRDPECVSLCNAGEFACKLGCGLIPNPLGAHLCRLGCATGGRFCRDRCFPLFPRDIFAERFL